jgi:AcrR family transcriptional regulator
VDDKRRLILDQALALVDERGLGAMSMRAVAERVGLTSMALYPYVGGKDALLDGLVDLLTIELGSTYGAEGAGIDWRRRLRALGRAVRRLAHAHPGAFPLLLNRPAAGASASWLTAALRATLHDAGAPPDQVPRLARMICAFLLGYTTGEVTGGLPGPTGATTGPEDPVGRGVDEGEGPGPGPRSDPQDTGQRRPPDHRGEGAGGTSRADDGGPDDGGPDDGGPDGDRRAAGDAEFDADLDDLVRMVEVAVQGR